MTGSWEQLRDLLREAEVNREAIEQQDSIIIALTDQIRDLEAERDAAHTLVGELHALLERHNAGRCTGRQVCSALDELEDLLR